MKDNGENFDLPSKAVVDACVELVRKFWTSVAKLEKLPTAFFISPSSARIAKTFLFAEAGIVKKYYGLFTRAGIEGFTPTRAVAQERMVVYPEIHISNALDSRNLKSMPHVDNLFELAVASMEHCKLSLNVGRYKLLSDHTRSSNERTRLYDGKIRLCSKMIYFVRARSFLFCFTFFEFHHSTLSQYIRSQLYSSFTLFLFNPISLFVSLLFYIVYFLLCLLLPFTSHEKHLFFIDFRFSLSIHHSYLSSSLFR
jgi:hypothetical protein